MGYDAYQLIASLHAAHSGPMVEVDGATGKLHVDADGRVRRELAWAQFQRGEPVALPEIENVGGPIQDISNDPEPLLPDAADDESWFEETREL